MHSHRLAIVRKLGGRLPEPVISLCGSPFIVEREDHKLSFDGVTLTDSLKRMLSTCQLIANGDRLLCFSGLPGTIVYTIFHLSIEILTSGIEQMERSGRLVIDQHLLCQIHTQGLFTIAQRQ